ncbi:hypothetical protein ACWGCW_01485 [Streptomyces sp. NPDC054933]
MGRTEGGGERLRRHPAGGRRRHGGKNLFYGGTWNPLGKQPVAALMPGLFSFADKP